MHGLAQRFVAFREPGGESACDGEERAGLHLDHAEVILLRDGEIESALGLENFSFADFAGSLADGPAKIKVVEVGGEF